MAKVKSGVGLDVGGNYIKIVELVQTSQGIELKNANIVRINTKDGRSKEENIVSALTEAVAPFKKFEKSQLVVSMPGRSVIIRHFNVPSVRASRIKQIIKYEAQQQVPFPLEEVIWDYQILKDDDKTIQEINVALVAVKSGLINDLLARISSVGIAADLIEATSFAVFDCAKFNDVLDNGPIVLIDIGAISTDISVASGEQLVFSRSIHIAGNDITRAIQKERSVGFEDAEKVKFKKEDINAAVSVLETLSGEIHRSISFYMSQMDRKAEFRKVVLTGQASNLKEIAAFLSNNLKMEVVELNPFSNILISNKKVLDIVSQTPNAWSVAIGSALTALGESDTKANLLPPELITEKKFKKKRMPLIMSAVLSILIFITVHIFTIQSYTIKYSKLQRIKDILKKYDSFVPRINELKDERTKIKQRLNVSKSVIFKRDLWARTLMEISRLTPSSVIISQFSSHVGEKENALSIVGLADSYPALDDFISRLKFSPYFENAKLISAKENKGSTDSDLKAERTEQVKIQFELNLVLKKE
ncbi:type IV pilus assembly protein PilM [bacterium]|nr:type IV pilus assembly protein PilM [bacterium]